MLIKTGKPPFEIKPIAEDQLRPLRAFDIAWRGLVIVDLRARFGDGADDGGVAGHVLRHIGDNREGSDNPEFLLRGGRRRGQQSQRAGQQQ